MGLGGTVLPAGAPSLINLDDPRGAALVEMADRPVTYAINRTADITPGPLSFSLEGLAATLRRFVARSDTGEPALASPDLAPAPNRAA